VKVVSEAKRRVLEEKVLKWVAVQPSVTATARTSPTQRADSAVASLVQTK
jgi:hypothetical protein